MFVIGAALILVSLLFRLGLQQRASELGLLKAIGFSHKQNPPHLPLRDGSRLVPWGHARHLSRDGLRMAYDLRP